MAEQGNFDSAREQLQSNDGAAETSVQKLFDDTRDFGAKGANVADAAGFEKVSSFLQSMMNKDGSWNLENVTQKDITDMLALNGQQIENATRHQKKVSADLDAAVLNLKQFG